MDENIQAKVLHVTRRELFYAAMMLGIRQLVNIVYDFPASELKLQKELDAVKKELRQKKLLIESARGGVSLDFQLTMCVTFCSEPENCEFIDKENYQATIYHAADMFMLLENHEDDGLMALWFINRDSLNSYINSKIDIDIRSNDNGQS